MYKMLAYSMLKNTSFWQVYQDFTYDFHQDFNVTLEYENWPTQKKAKLKLESISTYRYDMCTLIQPLDSLPSNHGKYVFQIHLSPDLASEDIQAEITLALTSETSWQGFLMDDWPQIKPPIVRLLSSIFLFTSISTSSYILTSTS